MASNCFKLLSGRLAEELQKNCGTTAEELQKNCSWTAEELQRWIALKIAPNFLAFLKGAFSPKRPKGASSPKLKKWERMLINMNDFLGGRKFLKKQPRTCKRTAAKNCVEFFSEWTEEFLSGRPAEELRNNCRRTAAKNCSELLRIV